PSSMAATRYGRQRWGRCRSTTAGWRKCTGRGRVEGWRDYGIIAPDSRPGLPALQANRMSSLATLFNKAPIKVKLVYISLLVTTITLLLVSVSYSAFQIHSYRDSLYRNMESVSRLLAVNATTALILDNPDSAELAFAAAASVDSIDRI